MKKLFIFSLATATLASCAVQQPKTPPTPPTPEPEVIVTADYTESTARLLEPEQKMLLTTLIADLEVSDKKVYYTETEAFAEFEVTEALIQNIAALKKIAVSRAAKAHKADVLVGTSIDVITKNGRLQITVSGYPAYYVRFRNVTEKEIKLLKEAQGLDSKNGSDVISTPAHLKVDIQK